MDLGMDRSIVSAACANPRHLRPADALVTVVILSFPGLCSINACAVY